MWTGAKKKQITQSKGFNLLAKGLGKEPDLQGPPKHQQLRGHLDLGGSLIPEGRHCYRKGVLIDGK